MTRHKLLQTTAIAGLFALFLAPPAALSQDTAGMAAANITAISSQAKPNTYWWPDQLDLSTLRDHVLT